MFGPKTNATSDRAVRCYHCGAGHSVSAHAMSASCPSCHKQIRVDDIVVRGQEWTSTLATCGRVIVQKKGRVIASRVIASEGVEVEGRLEASVQTAGPLVVLARGVVKGDCVAPSLCIDPGGTIEGGFVQIRGATASGAA